MKTQTKSRKTKIMVALFCLGVTTLSVFGQQPVKQPIQKSEDRPESVKPAAPIFQMENSGGQAVKTYPAGTPGDAFLQSDWQPGTAILKDGNVIDIPSIRYNLLTQQMQFIKGKEVLALANPEEIKLLRIADKVFVYDDFVCGGLQKKGYPEVIETGSCSLLRRWTASYKQVDALTGEEIIYRNQIFLLQFDDGPATEVNHNLRLFCDAFGRFSSEIKQQIRSERLKIRNPEDLQKIVAYYNQLIESK